MIRELEPMLRFVRDAHEIGHSTYRRATIVEQFGQERFDQALELGLIERQIWQGRATDWIDLSATGEKVLLGIARANLRKLEGRVCR